MESAGEGLSALLSIHDHLEARRRLFGEDLEQRVELADRHALIEQQHRHRRQLASEAGAQRLWAFGQERPGAHEDLAVADALASHRDHATVRRRHAPRVGGGDQRHVHVGHVREGEQPSALRRDQLFSRHSVEHGRDPHDRDQSEEPRARRGRATLDRAREHVAAGEERNEHRRERGESEAGGDHELLFDHREPPVRQAQP